MAMRDVGKTVGGFAALLAESLRLSGKSL